MIKIIAVIVGITGIGCTSSLHFYLSHDNANVLFSLNPFDTEFLLIGHRVVDRMQDLEMEHGYLRGKSLINW